MSLFSASSHVLLQSTLSGRPGFGFNASSQLSGSRSSEKDDEREQGCEEEKAGEKAAAATARKYHTPHKGR
jgi:hypothetical protein